MIQKTLKERIRHFSGPLLEGLLALLCLLLIAQPWSTQLPAAADGALQIEATATPIDTLDRFPVRLVVNDDSAKHVQRSEWSTVTR